MNMGMRTYPSTRLISEDTVLIWIAGLSDKSIQGNCIKMLYECGARQPALIAPYWKEFLALLKHPVNRIQWGAMIALSTITLERHQQIFNALPQILDAADMGSVITKDHAVKILVLLCSFPQYSMHCFPLLHSQILSAPPNQFPSYAEQALTFIGDDNRNMFLNTLIQRLPDITTESKLKRVEKLIRKLKMR